MNIENINIENKNGEMVVSSREVARNFEKEHSKVLRSIECLKESQPSQKWLRYFILNEYKDLKGEQRKEYLLTRDGFSLLVMGFTGEKALNWKLKYIEAFNDMENAIQKVLPSNYKEALQQLLVSEEEKEKLQLTLQEQKSKVIFADSVSASATSILVGELAKLIKQNGHEIGQNRLFQWLRDNNYLISRNGTDYNMPTQKSMELGLFEIKETSITHSDGHISVNKTPKVTGKGQVYFINKFTSLEA